MERGVWHGPGGQSPRLPLACSPVLGDKEDIVRNHLKPQWRPHCSWEPECRGRHLRGCPVISGTCGVLEFSQIQRSQPWGRLRHHLLERDSQGGRGCGFPIKQLGLLFLTRCLERSGESRCRLCAVDCSIPSLQSGGPSLEVVPGSWLCTGLQGAAVCYWS